MRQLATMLAEALSLSHAAASSESQAYDQDLAIRLIKGFATRRGRPRGRPKVCVCTRKLAVRHERRQSRSDATHRPGAMQTPLHAILKKSLERF